MATITKVIRFDWKGDKPDVELKKFIPEELMTYEGSFGHGGEPVYDPIQAANNFARDLRDNCLKIQVIDTQSPVDSDSHCKTIYPEFTKRILLKNKTCTSVR